MCRHTGLLVCFACLFLSVNSSSSLTEKKIRDETSCNTAKLFESYSNNGSLSLEGLDQILKSVRNLCPSHWKEKESSPSELETIKDDIHSNPAQSETSSGNGKY